MNRKKSIILISVNAVVWGFLLYRIVWFKQKDDSYDAIKTVNIQPANNSVDSDSLILNYADPFLAGFPNDEETWEEDQIFSAPVSPPSLVFLGMVKNHGRKMSFASLKLGDKHFIVKKNDVFEGITIKSIFSDSIVVSYSGTSFRYFLNNRK